MKALHTLGARRIAEGVRAREFTARSVAEAFLERALRFDGDLRAFVDIDAELTLAAAERVDRRLAEGRQLGPLAGVPVAVKDNLCMRGLPTTCGSRMLAAWHPPYDADAVERLLAADAVPFGKTNLDEFGMGSSTEWSAFGPTANPWDRERVPGGSSGGSAAAVAAGLVPLALGSDTGGSVRQPAAFCGVFGIAPTYGRVSRRGLVAFASSLDRVGAFAHRADDLAMLLGALSGGDAGDATSVHDAPPDWVADVASGVRGLRIGVLTGASGVDAEIAEALDGAIAALGAAGATLREAVLAGARDALSAYHLLAAAEASSNLARYDGVRYGLRPSDDATDAESAARGVRARGFGEEVRRRLVLGTLALSAGHRDELHARAVATRERLRDAYADLLDDVDVVLSPTTPTPAFRRGERVSDPLRMYDADALTTPSSLAGLPGVSVPVGRTAAGLPTAVQAVAAGGREDLLFRVAGALERALGTPTLPERFA
jgi:aspartyl-tRNA(Asn)/glutamyl-tRNA(Gln) amidotransferase subunit A